MFVPKSYSTNIMELFDSKDMVKVCAPMVRYSKLQFRTLVKKYGCDLCFTPMILADSFCKSEKARNNEFTTSQGDDPVVVQFAANTVHDFIGAAHMVSPYSNGVDLNVGCPQRWAKQMGIGCVMLEKPELVADLVRQCRNRISKPFTVSVKMRILKELKETVEVCKRLEKAGISFLTVHGRTPSQTSGEVNYEYLKVISEDLDCPVIANGGVRSLEECYLLQERVSCKGVMVANGLLTNPTLFFGNETTNLQCVQNWLDICYNSTLTREEYLNVQNERKPKIKEKPRNLTFQCFHHHLVFMLEKFLPRFKRRIFNNLQCFKDVLEFLDVELNLRPRLFKEDDFYSNCVTNLEYVNRDCVYRELKFENCIDLKENYYDFDGNEGQFFKSKVGEAESDGESSGLGDIFLEDELINF